MTDWAKLKVVDLKAELKRRDLPQQGLKAELVARLEETEAETGKSSAADEGEGEGNASGPNEEAPIQTEADLPPPVTSTEPEIPAVTTTDSKQEDPEVNEAALGAAEFVPSPSAVGVASPTKPQVEESPMPDAGTETIPEKQEVVTSTADLSEKLASVEDATPVNDPVEEGGPKDSLPSEKTASEADGHATQNQRATEDTQAMDVDPTETAETVVLDATGSQDRKRRSRSPPPDEETVSRKRARPDRIDQINGTIRSNQEPGAHADTQDDAMEVEHDVAPALHAATSAIYVCNLMRPLRPNDVRTHLVNLATPANTDPDDGIMTTLHLDSIRTHAFAVFESVSAASRVRSQLHDTVWPKESNRKPLWVDFIPPEKVPEWIEKEDQGGRSGPRWTIVYEANEEGEMQAQLDAVSSRTEGSGPGPAPQGPRGPSATSGRMPGELSSVNALPTGPRAMREPPRGPRNPRANLPPPGEDDFERDSGRRAPPGGVGGGRDRRDGPRFDPLDDPSFERTRAYPVIAFKPVSMELVDRRMDSMHSFYTPDLDRPLGREINRYSFQHGDSFVDRGKEVFEGIRPPHRERAMRGGGGRSRFGDRRRGGGGRGGGRRGGGWGGGDAFRGSASGGGDSYVPGGSRVGRDRSPDY